MDKSDNTPFPETWDAMLHRYRDAGWEPTLLTFMFAHMLGSDASIQRQQRADVGTIYRWALTRIVRDPDRPSNAERRPIWLCSPDFPVFKHDKQSLRDVTINGGQHVHAYALTPPDNRLKGRSLTQLIIDNQAGVIAHTRCVRVHAVPVEDNDAGVLRYIRKSEQRGRIDEDAFVVFPRTLDEVREGPARVGRQSSIFAAPRASKTR